MRRLLACVAVLLAPAVHAQSAAGATSDTLTLREVWRLAAANHPGMRQARAAFEQASAEARTARGAYDPSVSASWEQKEFSGSLYYDYLKGTATVPTPLGVDLKLSYESAAGRYINPDRRTTSNGLLSLGFSLPVGQRWLVDDRRTALQVAKESQRIAAAELRAAGNRVILEVTKDYARWMEAYRRAGIAREGVTMANARYRFTRTRVDAGEAAPMDTIEALLEVQRRSSTLSESEQLLFNARAALALDLWDGNGRPVALSEQAVPAWDVPDAPPPTDEVISRFVLQHPDVLKAGSRISQTRAQQRLAQAQRIPLPSLEMFALSAPDEFPLSNSVQYGSNADNLKRGASLTVPLLFLKERGRADAAVARNVQSVVDRSRVERLISTNIGIAIREMNTARELLQLQQAIVANSTVLVRGEDTRFQNGESTLLLVMIRERSLLDEMLRVASLELRLLSAYGERVALTGEWEAVAAGQSR